jgi:hypothetical protein
MGFGVCFWSTILNTSESPATSSGSGGLRFTIRFHLT